MVGPGAVRRSIARAILIRAGLIVAAGSLIRVLYVLIVIRHVAPGLDAVWYTLQGGSIRDGSGYVVPTSLFTGPRIPTAAFPPLYPVYQALWQSVFDGGPLSVRLAGVVPGAVTVVAAGLLGRRVGGDRVGLVAAGIVAVDPVLVAVDGSTMSENLSVALVLLAVLVAVAIDLDRDTRRTPAMVIALGLVVGLAALTRQDLVLLVGGLLLPVAFLVGGSTRRRVALAACGLAATAVLVVPWSVRNHDRVGTWSTSTLSATSALAGANCERTYGGPSIGSWEFSCVAAAQDPSLGEAAQAARYQRTAVSYARGHAGSLPLVVAAREARVWGIWDPRDQLPREAEESRRWGWQALAWPWRIALVTVGAVGLVGLVRRHRAAWPLLVPVAVVVTSAGIGQGNPRFSAIAHPVLAVGVAVLAARVSAGRTR